MHAVRRRELIFQNAHRAQARGPKVLQRSGGGAPAAAARTLQISVWTCLMSATHGRAQRNDFNVHLDSAGDRFGATAHGGSRRRILAVGEKCDEGPEVLYRPLI